MIEKGMEKIISCFLIFVTLFFSDVVALSLSDISGKINNRLFSDNFPSFRPSLTVSTEDYINPPRGIEGDLWADIIIGQPDFSEITPNRVVPYRVFYPGGIAVDKSVSPGRLYVWDSGNNRILGVDLAKCYSGESSCTADIVIGQPSAGYDHSGCNGDSGFQNYPQRAIPSSSTLCSVPEYVHSITESVPFMGIYVDEDGNLYIPDPWNHRVLKYNKPFETDTIADDLWGQDDFSGNICNKGKSKDDTSLCFFSGEFSGRTVIYGGVTLDPDGNLWVADSGNQRILRFPKDLSTNKIGKKADLIFKGPISNPTSIRLDSHGNIYVSDKMKNKIFKFQKDFGFESVEFGRDHCSPISVEIDPLNRGLWVLNHYDPHDSSPDCASWESKLVLWSYDGQSILKTIPLSSQAGGSIGFDTFGNIIFSAYPKNEVYILDSSYNINKGLFSLLSFERNKIDRADLGWSVIGMDVTKNQLVVSDSGRILFWNDLDSFYNGKPADGVLGVSDFETYPLPHYSRISADKYNLWAIRQDTIERFELPLTFGDTPEQVIKLNSLKLLGEIEPIEVDISDNTGIFADEGGRYLWLSLPYNERVIRVRIPENYEGDYLVDVVIGGEDIPKPNRAWHKTCPPFPFLCSPGFAVEDNRFNLYISDYYLENEGSGFLYVFDKDLFPLDSGHLMTYDTSNANKKFSVAGWEPAFNSQNKMVIGFPIAFGRSRFPFIYGDITTQSELVNFNRVMDYHSQAFSIKFDYEDNLYITDLNRGRVLIYKKPSLDNLPLKEIVAPKNYPEDKWDRIWYDDFFLSDEPDEESILFDNNWGKDLVAGIKKDYIGFTSYRKIYFEESGIYEFNIGSYGSDSFKLKIEDLDEQIIYENPFGFGWEEKTHRIYIPKGYHDVILQYFHNEGESRFSFKFSYSISIDKESKGEIYLGEQGESCDQVCDHQGKICDPTFDGLISKDNCEEFEEFIDNCDCVHLDYLDDTTPYFDFSSGECFSIPGRVPPSCSSGKSYSMRLCRCIDIEEIKNKLKCSSYSCALYFELESDIEGEIIIFKFYVTDENGMIKTSIVEKMSSEFSTFGNGYIVNIYFHPSIFSLFPQETTYYVNWAAYKEDDPETPIAMSLPPLSEDAKITVE